MEKLLDGEAGTCEPRPAKKLKFLAVAWVLAHQQTCTLKELQACCGGLVYISMCRRALLSLLNLVWRFMASLKSSSTKRLPIPHGVRKGLLCFIASSPFAIMHLRRDFSPVAMCSDASDSGAVAQGFAEAWVSLGLA